MHGSQVYIRIDFHGHVDKFHSVYNIMTSL